MTLRLPRPWREVAGWTGRARLSVVRLVEPLRVVAVHQAAPLRVDWAHQAAPLRADWAQLPLLVVARLWPVAQELMLQVRQYFPVAKSALGSAGQDVVYCPVDQDAACCLVDQGAAYLQLLLAQSTLVELSQSRLAQLAQSRLARSAQSRLAVAGEQTPCHHR